MHDISPKYTYKVGKHSISNFLFLPWHFLSHYGNILPSVTFANLELIHHKKSPFEPLFSLLMPPPAKVPASVKAEAIYNIHTQSSGQRCAYRKKASDNFSKLKLTVAVDCDLLKTTNTCCFVVALRIPSYKSISEEDAPLSIEEQNNWPFLQVSTYSFQK